MAQRTAMTGMTDRIAAMQDFQLYRELHWEGGFEDYLASFARSRRSRATRTSGSTT